MYVHVLHMYMYNNVQYVPNSYLDTQPTHAMDLQPDAYQQNIFKISKLLRNNLASIIKCFKRVLLVKCLTENEQQVHDCVITYYKYNGYTYVF